VPYKIVKAANGDAHVQVEINGQKKTFSPPEISAMILSKLKADAENKARRESQPGSYHRSGLLQRLATQRYEGRGQDRRSGSSAHHQ